MQNRNLKITCGGTAGIVNITLIYMARAMKETKISSLWKKSVKWDKMTGKQKAISIWFSLSFVLLGLSCTSLFVAVLAVANFAAAAYHVVKYVPMDDE